MSDFDAFMEHHEIVVQPVITEADGSPIDNCADNKADTFLILLDGVEVMRASTRQMAHAWIDSPEGQADMMGLDGTSGQDRESYSDTQDRSNYS